MDDTQFENVVMAHLHAAHNLAHWLTRNDRDAEDLVQEACLRALRFIGTFRGGNGRAWLLAIVRNAYYSGLKKNRAHAHEVPFDEDQLDDKDRADFEGAGSRGDDMASGLEREESQRQVRNALDRLPVEYREIIVLRELEDLSYQEIANIAQIPIGTVMSRLSRARKLLQRHLQYTREES